MSNGSSLLKAIYKDTASAVSSGAFMLKHLKGEDAYMLNNYNIFFDTNKRQEDSNTKLFIKFLEIKPQKAYTTSLLTDKTLLTSALPYLVRDFKANVVNLSYSEILETMHCRNRNLNQTYSYKIFTSQDESIRINKPQFGKTIPVTLIKIPVNYTEDSTNNLFKLRYNDQNSKVASRNMVKVPYFVFKQVKYKARTGFTSSHLMQNSDETSSIVKKSFSLHNQYSVEHENVINPRRHYRMLKKNRVRSEVMPVIVSKRLLRVKRTLVIPTHINITAITNSYDVVHS